MTPAIAVLLGLGGYVAYDKLGAKTSDASQPLPKEQRHFLGDWFNNPSQPQTGNGQPATDAGAVSRAVSDVAKFGTSLISYFGTSKSQGNDFGGGISTGGPTESYEQWQGGYEASQGYTSPPLVSADDWDSFK